LAEELTKQHHPVSGRTVALLLRLFCFITKNWRGRPVATHEVIVKLIASSNTKTGLTVRAALDARRYETGVAVSDEELAELRVVRAKFHGDWNYSIKPRHRKL
jgi:hypothetical protein